MECAVSQALRPPVFRSTFQARDAVSHERDVFYVSSSANFRVSDPRYGAANMDVSCRHSAKDGAYVGHPASQRKSYTVSLLCVVSTERCVSQVLLCIVSTESCVTQVPLVQIKVHRHVLPILLVAFPFHSSVLTYFVGEEGIHRHHVLRVPQCCFPNEF